MLGKYIVIGDKQMPNANRGTFSYTHVASENVFENEAGGQLSNIKRLNRVSWKGEFNCTSRMRDILVAKALTPEVNCVVDGKSMTGRLRIAGDITLVEGSENVKGTEGLWVLPLVFEEC